ncbi:MAG: ABC transporter ATP-binding protein [Termitinemataceae bacterium]|nr:MAG: ABC transporter ATP-binding protein [Termitinemataceae bacterium]
MLLKSTSTKIGTHDLSGKLLDGERQQPVISFKDFGFRYKTQAEPTLFNINLDIMAGEKVLIAGASGSGKSTLAHCINGLIPFSYAGETSGNLTFGLNRRASQQTKTFVPKNIFDLSKYVGTVLQDSDGQFVGLSVGEDIAFALENDCVKTAVMKEYVSAAAALVDMDTLLLSSPYHLSGGQKQRTSLAGVLVDDTPILLFDEPLAALDPAAGKSAIEIIDDIHQKTGKTIIIIEHRLEDVLHRPVDRVIIMNEGHIVSDTNPSTLLCSSVLAEFGIREPLYITAMKYAGITPDPTMDVQSINTLNIEMIRAPITKWFEETTISKQTNTNNSIIKLEHIDFSYLPVQQKKKNTTIEKYILRDINFEIKKGEMVSIIGKNGSGKTTITKLLAGFETQQSGKIFLDGHDADNLTIAERADILGLVMQNPNSMICETFVYDETSLGLKLRGKSKGEIDERVHTALKICGLSPFINWPVSALSYGQKKRLTIASMLVLDPKVLVLDEPTAGQDYRHYSEIMEFLCSLNDMGISIILITHDMHLMLQFTPRAIVISDGKLLCDCCASEVLSSSTIIEKAALKETSLYTLAKKLNLPSTEFVECFIAN